MNFLQLIGEAKMDLGEDKQDDVMFKVVLNHEEQYSIWPVGRENPVGWKDSGKSGNKEECLKFIKEVWTDMRPLTLRKSMDQENSPSSIKLLRS